MVTPGWVDALEHFAAVVAPVLTFALGKAMKGGANQVLLDQNVSRVKTLEEQLSNMALTLAEHSSLHGGYVQNNRFQQEQLLSVDRKVNLICGKLGIAGVGNER
jgi:hypothetical protein